MTTPSVYATRPWLKHYDYWMPPHLTYPARPLYEILSTTAVEMPEAPATAFLGATLTFAEIRTRTERLAAALLRLGIVKGDRVGIMLPNCPQYIIATFATLRLGAVVVNINPIYTAREVLNVATDFGDQDPDHARPAGTAGARHPHGHQHRAHRHHVAGRVFRGSSAAAECGRHAGAQRV